MPNERARKAAWETAHRWEQRYATHPDREKMLEVLGVKSIRKSLEGLEETGKEGLVPEETEKQIAMSGHGVNAKTVRFEPPQGTEAEGLPSTSGRWFASVTVGCVLLVLAFGGWYLHRRLQGGEGVRK